MSGKKNLSIALSVALATGAPAALAVADEAQTIEPEAVVEAAVEEAAVEAEVASVEETVVDEVEVANSIANPDSGTTADGVFQWTELYDEDGEVTTNVRLTLNKDVENVVIPATVPDASGNGALTVTSVDISGTQAQSVKSIDATAATGLTSLYVVAPSLESLDLSGTSIDDEWEVWAGSALQTVDLSGCKGLTNLNKLSISSATSVDLSGCTGLTTIEYGELASAATVNLSGCSGLTWANLGDGQISSIDLSGCTKLEYLNLTSNKLESIDVSACTALVDLELANNYLTTFDYSAFEKLGDKCKLTTLNVSYNLIDSIKYENALEAWAAKAGVTLTFDPQSIAKQIVWSYYEGTLTLESAGDATEITVPADYEGLPIYYVNATGLGLTKIDLSNVTDTLLGLDVTGNALTSLDLTKCARLTYVLCSDNALTSLTFNDDAPISWIDCSNNQLTALDLSGLDDLYTYGEVDCSNNQLTTAGLSLKQTKVYGNVVNYAPTYFDASNNNLTGSLILTARQEYSTRGYAYIYLDNNGLTSLTAYAHEGTYGVVAPAISVVNNNLTELNVPQTCISIDCSNNALTTLSASVAKHLDCSNNALTSLDVAFPQISTYKSYWGNTDGYDWYNRYLDCSNNELTSLDLSKVFGLVSLDCSYNGLSTIDVSSCFYDFTDGEMSPYVDTVNLDCSFNSIANTGALVDWAAIDGHQAVIFPQECAPTAFTDVASGSWYASWVTQAAEAGLMSGIQFNGVYTGEFAPESNLTRGQVAIILYRLATGETGNPAVPETVSFSDTAGHWAAGAIEWCAEQGIVTGYNGKFAPDAYVTRQELAAMVGRYAEKIAGIDISTASATAYKACTDAGTEDAYATEYLKWTADEGILSGYSTASGKTLAPSDTATRAQAAKIFVMLAEVCD